MIKESIPKLTGIDLRNCNSAEQSELCLEVRGGGHLYRKENLVLKTDLGQFLTFLIIPPYQEQSSLPSRISYEVCSMFLRAQHS